MRILVTGGAGFIGSNLVAHLLSDNTITFVRVLDNLSTGFKKHLQAFYTNPKFEFVEGDITNYNQVLAATQTITHVFHQAALGSVPRSITDPLATNNANITGTLNVFTAAKDCGVRRVIFAASSSTYGDSTNLPKVEHIIGKPLSPYAVTKYVMELYADVFSRTYGLEYIGLRYFNVFGPHQNPNGAYAAVIPLFVDHALRGAAPTINGDGANSRDFTYVDNVVHANMQALQTTNSQAVNQVYNIAYGEGTTLVQLYNHIQEVCGTEVLPIYGPTRVGDIPHSLANIDKAKQLLHYNPQVDIKEGLQKTIAWYRANQGYFTY
jgi:UDP-N-acetylglucosamine/UDP-N-acetylgalactosamine 4-epimerase